MYCTKCFNISPFCSMYFFQYKCKHFTKYATIHWKCQSSCYKSTKRCVQTVKLNSLKEICVFIWVFERTSFADSFSVLILFWLCTFIASPTAVTQPHQFLFYILAIQHVIKIIFRSLESLVQIVSYFLYILSLSLFSLSLSPRIYMLNFQYYTNLCNNIWKTHQIWAVPHAFMAGTSRCPFYVIFSI